MAPLIPNHILPLNIKPVIRNTVCYWHH